MDAEPRPIVYLGSSQKDLSKLPAKVRETFVYGLRMASNGGTHPDAKVLKGFGGRGVLELIGHHKGEQHLIKLR